MDDDVLVLGKLAELVHTGGRDALREEFGDAPVLVLRIGGEDASMIDTHAHPLGERVEGRRPKHDETARIPRVSPWAHLAQAKSLVFPVRKTDRNPFGGFVTIGRAQNNDVCLPSSSVSKLHALMKPGEHNWRLQDKSSNGTWIDQVRLEAGPDHNLQYGQQVAFADVEGMFLDQDGLMALCATLK